MLCFSLSIGVVSSIGIFNGVLDTNTTDTIQISEINESMAMGITEINSDNITSGEDIADSMGGTAMITQMYHSFTTMLGIIFLPYKFMVGIGIPAYLAMPVQVVFNVTFIWACVQFLTGRSTKTSD